MKFTAIALALASTVMAEIYYITTPIGGTVYQAGSVAKMRWIKAENREFEVDDVASIQIDLMDGDSNAGTTLATIATIDGPAESYDWQVPADMVSANTYFLKMRVRSKSGTEVLNYSTRFSITGGSGSGVGPGKPSPSVKKSDATSVATGFGLASIAGMFAALFA